MGRAESGLRGTRLLALAPPEAETATLRLLALVAGEAAPAHLIADVERADGAALLEEVALVDVGERTPSSLEQRSCGSRSSLHLRQKENAPRSPGTFGGPSRG